MTDKQASLLAMNLKGKLLKDFGKTRCREMTMDCVACQAHALIGYLNWYSTLLEFPAFKKKRRKKTIS